MKYKIIYNILYSNPLHVYLNKLKRTALSPKLSLKLLTKAKVGRYVSSLIHVLYPDTDCKLSTAPISIITQLQIPPLRRTIKLLFDLKKVILMFEICRVVKIKDITYFDVNSTRDSWKRKSSLQYTY
jgi:hypothetical protein